ncbi:MAG: protein phosphatase 2C family protein [Alphaproteobacteria bacterium]|nr:protein phosphatase 2C family protein [Alphaproteobacteria bacterium]
MTFVLKEEHYFSALEKTLNGLNDNPLPTAFMLHPDYDYLGCFDIKSFVLHYFLDNPTCQDMNFQNIERLLRELDEKQYTQRYFSNFIHQFLQELRLLNNQCQHEESMREKEHWPVLVGELTDELTAKEDNISSSIILGKLKVCIEETIGRRPRQEDAYYLDIADAIPEEHRLKIPEVLQKTFAACQKKIEQNFPPRKLKRGGTLSAGSTALLGYLSGTNLYLANTGDSVAALFFVNEEGHYESMQLNLEHTTTDLLNHRFVTTHQGTVNAKGQINNSLSVGRALGDSYLLGALCAQPDILHFDLAELFKDRKIQLSTLRLIFACDGAFECRDPAKKTLALANFCRLFDTISDKESPLAALMLRAAFNAVSNDNISVLELFFESVLLSELSQEAVHDYVFALYDGHGGQVVAKWLATNWILQFRMIWDELVPGGKISSQVSTRENSDAEDELEEPSPIEIKEEVNPTPVVNRQDTLTENANTSKLNERKRGSYQPGTDEGIEPSKRQKRSDWSQHVLQVQPIESQKPEQAKTQYWTDTALKKSGGNGRTFSMGGE